MPSDGPPMVDVEPTASPSKARPRWFGWAIGAIVVIVAVGAFFVTKSVVGGGGSSPASASTRNGAASDNGGNGNGSFQGRFPGTSGTITAIDGTTLTVKDQQNNSVKVTTDDNTRVTVEKTVTVSDIAKGDRISVTGTQSGTTVAASRISIMDAQAQTPNGGQGQGTNGPPGGFGGEGGFPGGGGNGTPPSSANAQPPGGFTIGTVTAIDGGTITISSFDGSTVTVTTTSSTTVMKSAQGSLSDLKVGQNVRATGTTGSDGTVAATSINEGSGGFGFGGGRRGQGAP